ncbi:hypothetical protein HOE37_05025 [Candidatus Woesearchaeota archaeon]|jgi:hypothetical protein|nr:hypothetical protein [Candidatus Woesearchaeota archaeon]MBT4111195.1 hypothetical protein [Candidatus Woesearchaeota archaeon]MBT4336775.1 hypothetical protein [Candidatus Woesearchaeota archaeon]MBT4469443.1 hypothetical protein [Candidatus Woesearchaeota archaeon]MBT6744162.1 hypothetical protein [Candidatus Woesearchaeota archaeon]
MKQETREELEERLQDREVYSLYTHLKVQLNALPPDGAKVHRKGNCLSGLTGRILRYEEKCIPYLSQDETFAQMKENTYVQYKESLNLVLEIRKQFPEIWF